MCGDIGVVDKTVNAAAGFSNESQQRYFTPLAEFPVVTNLSRLIPSKRR
jgi:hypothetical protein